MVASDRSVAYLIIGHVSKDLTADGPTLGGTATYLSLTAKALGKRAAIVTSVGPDLDLTPLSEVSVHIVPSQDSTIFANEYLPGERRHWTATRLANHLAAISVSRSGIASVPRSSEVKLVERTVIE
jgi:sugar/nucleoside kinase (ribokinase family)